MPRLFLLALFCPFLFGCATSYGPRKYEGGYSERRIQNDVYQVTVDGNAYAHKSQIEYFALVRAAELTVQQGREYFRILGGDTDIKSSQMYVPGQTFVNSSTYGNSYGQGYAYPMGGGQYGASGYGAYNSNTFTTAYSTPGYSTTIQKPIVTLNVQTLSKRIDPCLNAKEVLMGAMAEKLKLQPASLSAIGAVVKKS